MSLSKCFDYSKSEFTGSGRGLGIEDKTINCSGTDAFQNTGDITGKTDLKTEGECVTAQEKKTAPEEKAKGETLMVPSPSVSGASGNTKGDNPEDSQTEIKIENTEENDVTSSTDIVPTTKGEPTESADEAIAHVRSAEEPDSSTGTASDLFAYQASKYSGNLAFNLVDNTLPSSLAESAQENGEQNITGGLVGKTESGTEAQEFNRQDLILPHISQIYNELCVTYQEFQRERSAQEQYALELQRREYFLVQRETLLDRREAALAAIKHAEKEVQARFGIINKQHDTEMNRMKETLRGVAEENSRLKSSFNSVMDENDSLKKQLSDANEQNKKLDDGVRSMQAQLDNLKQPGTEMNRMKETLRGVAEENSKLKSSFKSVMDENDSLKKQLSDANEQNKKLDDRAKSMQAQLDNLKLYMTEMNRMRETVIEVGKENSTLKSSYNTVMDENDSLKKQLSDAKEQNKKLEDRARSMQAQLNDSKQKHALVMTQKSNDSGQVVRSRKRGMEKNETGASKSDKQPDTEMNRMKETLRGVAEENSKLKSSFKSVMDENDSLKKQLSDAKEQNKKLEDRARSMQAQLNDSKQKHALVMTQKSNDSGQVVRSRKRGMEKNETGASKSDKQPDTEMNRMKETLRGVAEENSKLKSSFKSVMDENDSLKKQLSGMYEYNKKLEDHARSMQAQLNDLQQKHALVMAQMSNVSGGVVYQRKRGNEEKETAISKSAKLYRTEMNRMRDALRGVAQENSRLKSSFTCVMVENDFLKNQLRGMYEYNKKLEDHARSMQAQLNDLQQKHALVMAQMSNVSGGVVYQRKRGNEEKQTAISKSAKLYRTEMNRMRDALRGVAQENSRLKSSFTFVMVENDSLKKQLSDANEQNKKLDGGARSMQAQLDNLKLYMTEMNRMRETVIEVGKENSTLKSSYNTVMDENDSLKKQLSDANEQNKKLEDHARSMQAQLNDLQQKHALVMAQKSNDSGGVVCQPKPVKEENETGASESDKVLLNSKVYDLLTILMDWISNEHLSKIEIQGEREGNDKPQCAKENCTPENCMKLLHVVTGQLQWMPFVDPKLYMPVIQFIYWSLRQINTGNKHASMTSTMERLGEVIFKGIEHQGNLQTWSEKSTQSTPKTVLFFTSSFMPLRFLSTLILLETAKFQRVNYLTHAFRSLCVDLRTDEGKMLFLQYQCVPVVLSHLTISRKCLLSCALDALTEMARSSDKNCLQLFLEYCSTESVFRACSELLQNPGLDMCFLKKICFMLRKLSEIKSNKKMFESFALPEVIKELLRTTHPDHHHFCVDLRVILYNLGVAESNSARLESKQK